MTRPATTRAPAARSLAQQKTDFTSEGAPPPVEAATSLPVVAVKGAIGMLPAPAPAGDARNQPPVGEDR
ncbi:MAG: hypothetical protein L6Q83_01225 [Gammaproteobacteria bacterium]|nr:hypothetical protein [Gammaproteobacteria bacterium]